MYQKFFGFKERPFQLVPNPAYLFLSRSHEEALAHLTYALSQGDGFVEVTGEVGTGKTTLCRVFLESLGENTVSAYIFNPMLDAVQLLKAVHDEFGITAETEDTKSLIDSLNTFLIEKKREGRQVILLIDEAQNLSRDVLEQLRLLSNLETTTSKLLQIILVGQPELREMLDSHDLRQLGQRITLSCHLVPLSFTETQAYIQHRIQIASQRPGVQFNRSAVRAVYRYAGGIPRLINIACDRTLLTAYTLNTRQITGSVAAAAIRELASRGDRARAGSWLGLQKTWLGIFERKAGLAFFAAAFLLILIGGIYWHRGGNDIQPDKAVSEVRPALASPETMTPQFSAEPAEAVSPADQQKNLSHASEPETGTVVMIPEQDTDAAEIPASDAAAATLSSGTEETTLQAVEPADQEVTSEPAYVTDLAGFLNQYDLTASRQTALQAALGRWQNAVVINDDLNRMADAEAFFRIAARQNAFSLQRINGDLSVVRKLNLPAILELYPPDAPLPVYLTLTGLEDQRILLAWGNEAISVSPEELKSCWGGIAYIPWKNFYGLTGVIPRNTSPDSILTLKMMLREMGFEAVDVSPDYDENTQESVRAIQQKHGVRVDGAVGPMTKIILYNEIASLVIPHISDTSPSAAEEVES